MHLKDALALRQGELVSLIGAGGKTTTLFRLAKELRDQGGKILVTTTTKIFKPTKPHVERLFLVQDIDAFLTQSAAIEAPAAIGAGCGVDDEGKLIGLPSPWLDRLQSSGQFDWIVVEADGAGSRLFKVPSEMEPVVPHSCHVTIWIMAIKILGQPLHSNLIHRAERVTALLGVSPDTQLTKAHVVRLVRHPQGCLRGVPAHSRRIALINQADSPAEIEQAKVLGRDLLPCGFERVVITSYLSNEPVIEVLAH